MAFSIPELEIQFKRILQRLFGTSDFALQIEDRIGRYVSLVPLNASKIELHKDMLKLIVQIVTDIVQSPNKAHMRDYWMLIQNLETKIEERKNWNKSTKRPFLLKSVRSH